MNKSLFIPGVCLLFVVSGIYRAQMAKVATVDETYVVQSIAATAWTQVAGDPPAPKESPAIESLDDELLDGWPVLTRTSLMSRAGPRQRLYARIDSVASNSLSSRYVTLKTLRVVSNGRYNEFPLIIDHAIDRVMVFADKKWRDYDTWRPSAIKRFRKSSGLSGDTSLKQKSYQRPKGKTGSGFGMGRVLDPYFESYSQAR